MSAEELDQETNWPAYMDKLEADFIEDNEYPSVTERVRVLIGFTRRLLAERDELRKERDELLEGDWDSSVDWGDDA